MSKPTGPLATLLHSGMEEARRHDQTRVKLAEALDALRALAERFDGATNGRCNWCGAGRMSGRWDFDAEGGPEAPMACSSESCRTHAVRAILSPET